MKLLQPLKFPLIIVLLLLFALVLARCSSGGEATPIATVDPAAALASAPTIALAPAGGYAGASVNVRGSGWPPAKMVLIKLADVQGHSPVLAAATTAADGQFVAQFVYPDSERWLGAGVQTVIAQTQDNQVEVGVSFLVIPPEGAVPPTAALGVTPTVAATSIVTPTAAATAAATTTPTPTMTPAPTATIPLSADGLAVTPLPTATAAATATATPTASPTALPTALPTATPVAASLAVPADLPNSADLGNGYRIRFLGADQLAGGSSIWRYSVEKQAGAKRLQVLGLELPDCAQVLNASPAGWEAVPAGGDGDLGGISWKVKGNFQEGEFAVTVSGRVAAGTVHVAAKAPQIETGVIAGPQCR